ncbi:Hypothetical predicted protein [Mytilus galloprovincialis]|uniref:Mab-21-like HhH/H2TH-like domain-containing protein n=1 Tax=Mytilus galloprovincialis TaxID=29158 RepID=A0A8B6CKX5_MYTGA|nr:Hypothetical predicted protein [Mytilus galloprovincialis]
MNAVRDNLQSNKYVTFITSGSYGEGLEMRRSDIDVMMVQMQHEVCEEFKSHYQPKITLLLMESDDVKPCYTLLRLVYGRIPGVYKHNGQQYLSSTLHKQGFLNNGLNIIHGPCVSDKEGYIDSAACLHCKTWVSPAIQWITRSRYSWPSDDVKQSILKHGVLFVPIGVKGSPKEDIEWRVSFSVGEKLLINTFTHTQLLCYALLKILLKDVIATYFECKDFLCSYFLKTIIFWISKELPQSIWKPSNVIPCFMRCFRRLIYCVEYSVCLHYFIPENNMFENKIEGRGREILLEKLYTLYSYGWRCILFSDQISNFYPSMWNFRIEPHTLYVDDLHKKINSRFLILLRTFFKTCFYYKETRFKNAVYQTVSCPKSPIKDTYKYYMSMYSSELAQLIALDSTCSNNIYQCKQYKSCLSTLLQNVYHDAVSGWLMIASLFYKTKQYSKALYIIRYSISKCTQEKLCDYSTVSDYQLLNLISFQKTSFVNLRKFMLLDDIQFTKNSSLIPDELQMVDSIIKVYPASAYAYFLEFLCQYHLDNVRQCQDAIQGLRLVIVETYLITRFKAKKSYTLLEIALQLLVTMNPNDKHSYNLSN